MGPANVKQSQRIKDRDAKRRREEARFDRQERERQGNWASDVKKRLEEHKRECKEGNARLKRIEAEREKAAEDAKAEAEVKARRRWARRFSNTLSRPIYHKGRPYYATARETSSGVQVSLAKTWSVKDLDGFYSHVGSAKQGGYPPLSMQDYEAAFILGKMSSAGEFCHKCLPHDFAPFSGRNDYIVGMANVQGAERDGEVTETDPDLEEDADDESSDQESSDERSATADAEPHPVRGQQTAARNVRGPSCTGSRFCACFRCFALPDRRERIVAQDAPLPRRESAAPKRTRNEQGVRNPRKRRRTDSVPTAEESETSATIPTAARPEPTISAPPRPLRATRRGHEMQRASANEENAPSLSENRSPSQRGEPAPMPPPARTAPRRLARLEGVQAEARARHSMRTRRGSEPRSVREQCHEQITAEMVGEATVNHNNRVRSRYRS
ncbi:hypothetical protein PRZ48_011566 [Zasmidium cellare]|uniref:Uncharacterized protein n=1 Tax=Zasmidium cellare TaxID=395010 RepID=A0ABR0E6Q7_ZASCE|nr:hypothetical protein PRZ48_011566 [Zasmidium cellare]